MLYLTTGTPGAGKSLWTIATVEERRKKESRPVYYYNIKGLTLEWNEMTRDQVMRWWELPAGSIIVIDEAQDIFPKGSSTQRPPEHCDMIAKHRHQGFDIYLVSQHPMKLDANVRKDVEEHRHLMRKFGTTWVTVHLWKGVRDNCDKTRKDSIASQWRYPKEVYTWYKSAEVHTVRVRVPIQVWLMVLIPLGVAWCAWWVFYGRDQARQAEAARSAAPAGAPGASRPAGGSAPGAAAARGGNGYVAPQSAQAYAEAFSPRVEGMPFTAPRYDALTAPVRVPVVVGCWQTASKGDGWCITQQGTRIRLPPAVITAYLSSGGAFQDFDAGPAVGQEASSGGEGRSPSGRQTGGP